jgi:uncharacterized phage-like protein YoqJ
MKLKTNRCIISGADVLSLPFQFNEDSHECQTVKNELLNAIIYLHKNGVDEFYTDCSFGFPLWGGEIVTGLMRYNDIQLYVVFPHEGQPYKYAQNWQDRFYKVHELCSDVIPMFELFSRNDENELFIKAADYMLDDCGRLLFCGDDSENYIYSEAVKRGLLIKSLKI